MSHSERAHYSRTLDSWISGCSDVGLRHQSNQDAFFMAARSEPERAAVIAVADGVSSAAGSELASLVAVETCVESLLQQFASGVPSSVAFMRAFVDANRAVLEAKTDGQPSACTLISAHFEGKQIAIANVGDSRAYWFGDDGSAQILTVDDSMAQARIMMGEPREEAERGSHAITKWLGLNAANVAPTVTGLAPSTPGWLLLCTDGLWNYASAPETLHGVFRRLLESSESLEQLTESLVHWANEQGGRDNTTVVLLRVSSAP
ncbi:PP2C family serine/threonine-protein phosphatase [Tessaracoccus sp. OH4464_COT-324]|uniref:PP2C family protein-serine/threonine phosphatase n=1 Tax=Tessaracoccus sp. OH4464_COT-324 TaxID=2491059 RepID=UPI001319CCE3|nr:PP2C family protein-serine/threonine phosphatase [Tessaracoccus sp. OH4464_COT-324]